MFSYTDMLHEYRDCRRRGKCQSVAEFLTMPGGLEDRLKTQERGMGAASPSRSRAQAMSEARIDEEKEKCMKKTIFQTAKSDLETAAYQVAVDEVTDALLAAAVNYASTSLPKSYGRDVALFLSSKLGRGIFQLAIGWLATYMADTEYGEKLNNAKVLRLAEQFRIQGNAQAVSLAAKPLILMAKTHIAPFLLQLPEPRDASDSSG